MARTTDENVTPEREQPGSEQERLDIAQLGQLLRERRGLLSIRQAAAEADVSFSTFSRVEGGAQPDLATFARLCAWLRVSPSKFFTPIIERELSPLEEAITHLRADPRLTPQNAGRISSMLTELYTALARDVAALPVVACHLRASSVMRPGVPERLASVLQEMHHELERLVDAGQL